MANAQLRGTSDVDAALVQQYVNFADSEILPACCTWTFPTLGIMQYNKQVSSNCPEHEGVCFIAVLISGDRASSGNSEDSTTCIE